MQSNSHDQVKRGNYKEVLKLEIVIRKGNFQTIIILSVLWLLCLWQGITLRKIHQIVAAPIIIHVNGTHDGRFFKVVPTGNTLINKRPLIRLTTSNRQKRDTKDKKKEKEEREACEEVHDESESFIYTRDILFILADTVSPVSNDTLGHVLRFIHVPSILKIVPCRLRHLLMFSILTILRKILWNSAESLESTFFEKFSYIFVKETSVI